MIISRYARAKPMRGARKMNRMVNFHLVPHRMAANPALEIAAPAYPPMSAWEELDGSPNHHVSRSHTMAPVNPAMITYSSIFSRSTRPDPTVLATPSALDPTKNAGAAAAKFHHAAHSTA